MTDKITDKEIVKALECCVTSGDFTKSQIEICSPCPYADCGDCTGLLKANALDLINRQEKLIKKLEKVEYFADKTITTLQAENERLKEDVSKARRKALLEAFSKFAGHSDYHGDTILCKLKCMAEGKEVGNAKPLNKSEIKAEAYKEIAERIKLEFYYEFDELIPSIMADKIDNIVNELIGE